MPGGQAALSVVIRALVPPGASLLCESPTGPHLRLSYAAAEPREIREGVRILGRVLGEQGVAI